MKVLFYLLLIVVMFLLLSKTEISSSGIKIKEPLYGAGILLILLAIFLIELNARTIGYKEGFSDAKEEVIKVLSNIAEERKKESEQIKKDL